jgi:hypothetical protein
MHQQPVAVYVTSSSKVLLSMQQLAAADATYPCQHACPALRLLLLQNVQEQLVLWESETRRVQAESAALYSNFEDDDLFLAACNHAGQLGVRLWADNSQRQFAIKRLGEPAALLQYSWTECGIRAARTLAAVVLAAYGVPCSLHAVAWG